MKTTIPLAVLAAALAAAPLQAQGLAGTYTLSEGGSTLTLVLSQDPQGNLTGSLSSTTGARFQVQGQVQDGVGVGAITQGQGGSYFEAHPQGAALLLALIEPGPDGMPDYSQVRQLTFTRQGGGGFGAGPAQGGAAQGLFGAAPQGQSQGGFGSGPPASSGGFGSAPPAGSGGGQGAGLGSFQGAGQEIGQPQWGFAFRAPAGWKHQFTEGGVIMGHDSIAGLILVSPHTFTSAQELAGDLAQGLVQGGIRLAPTGQVRQLGQNVLAAEYQGVWEGSQAKGLCLGTLSPHGGGAYVLAVTTPEMYGQDQVQAAQAIAGSMRYSGAVSGGPPMPAGPPSGVDGIPDQGLVRHFASYWWKFERGALYSSGSSGLILLLKPDGTYSRSSQWQASGNLTGGDSTLSYGVTSEGQGRGTWSVTGDRYQGVIRLFGSGGGVEEIRYQVKDSSPQKFTDYLFNGQVFVSTDEATLRFAGYGDTEIPR